MKQLQRRGTVLVYTIIAFLALVAIISLAVDFGHVSVVRTELRTALDAASLAGAGGLTVSPAEARTRAKAVAAGNKVNGAALTLLDSDIQLGTWNGTTRQFTQLTGANESKATAVRINMPLRSSRGTQVGLSFAKLIGRDHVEMEVTSVGGYAAGMDVVLVQDITTSFSDELADAKIGDQALLDTLYANGGVGGLGIVVHTGWGTVLAPLQKVYNNYTALSNTISSIKLAGNPGMPVASGTDPAAGIDKAIEVFNGYSNPSASGNAIVLVSDGEPNSDSKGSHPGRTDAQMLTLAQQAADRAWAKGIHVYVVFFNRSNSTTAANKLKTLTRGNGAFVQTAVASQLPAALEGITKRLRLQLCQ